ncbi:MAG TPA: LCP family protein [Solirubrobacteraceae bacterium]|jgi:LCP family protein required for cell wall assembly|nr:LCP family protein [Solirubrobacteraceae bacterium]
MPDEREDRDEPPPQYTRYRARRRLETREDAPAKPPKAKGAKAVPGASQRSDRAPKSGENPKRRAARPQAPPPARSGKAGPGRSARAQPREPGVRKLARVAPGDGKPRLGWRRWATRKRVVLGLLAAIVGWVGLSLVLFLISSALERTSPPPGLSAVLDPSGYPLTSVNNILILGSDRRPHGSREPGAETQGPGRSDTILLIRTGGGHAARMSIPRDTVVEIPGHGLQKINAAHAYGGAAESISVIKHWLDIPINHLVEVNFEDFPQLIDAMGGVDYKGGCIVSRIDGGSSRGGYTLRLRAGTHHIDGRQALAIARTRENLCAPNENDLQREEHQQELFNAMKSRLLSPTSFFRLPWIAWNAPPAIISDMSGPTLLGLFGALGSAGTPQTRVLRPTGAVTLPDGEDGLTISESAKRADVASFMSG